MSDHNLNLKSSTLEKGAEIARCFLGKILSPAAEEFGLLLADNIKFVRFKNQIRILNKAQDHVKKRNINVKIIPTKVLVPLLEYASLEEDEKLQDKWANMIANMADSELNLQNHVFPYLLSQVSIQEYKELEFLKQHEDSFALLLADLSEKRRLYEEEKKVAAKSNTTPDRSKISKLENEVDQIEQQGFELDLYDFEKANLKRLGLIENLPPRVNIKEFKTGGSAMYFSGTTPEEWHDLETSYEYGTTGYRLSGLGEKFLEICDEAAPV